MSILNLRGAPSLGADSSNLDTIIHDLPRTGSGHSHHGHSSLTSSFVHGDRDGYRRKGHGNRGHNHHHHVGHYGHHGGNGNNNNDNNIHKFLPSHHHHMAGEVIGSSLNSSTAHTHFVTNANSGSSTSTGNVFSSFRRQRARTVSHDYIFRHSASGDMNVSSTSAPGMRPSSTPMPLPPPSPSPTSSGRFRKFRAATWDSAGVGLGILSLSPLSRLSSDRSDRSGFSDNNSKVNDDTSIAAGVGSGTNADLEKDAVNSCDQGLISEHDVYFEDSSYDSELSSKLIENDDGNDRMNEGNDGMDDRFAGRIDLPPRLPVSTVECKTGIEESNQSSILEGMKDDENMEQEKNKFQSAIRSQIRAHQNAATNTNHDNLSHSYIHCVPQLSATSEHSENTTNTNKSSKREVKFSNRITEYSITDTSNLESQSIVTTFPIEEEDPDYVHNDANITHPDPERRHAIHRDPLTSSKVLSIESSALSLEKELARERRQRYSQYDSSYNDRHDFFTKLNPFRNLSWSLVGSYIVRTAPCFWCMRKLSISATDREILLRLNGLCSFFCVVQIALGLFLFSTSVMGVVQERDDAVEEAALADDGNAPKSKQSELENEEDLTNLILISPDLWNLKLFVYMLSIVNVVLLIASVLSQRVIREVNLVGSVRFMWSLFWLLPIQIFLMIGLFDYYRVMEVWIKHFWGDASMAYLRGLFCEEGTENDQCIVPIGGGEDYKNEKAWCLAKYNSTRCENIRNEAQYECTVASYIFFTSNGVWALILVFLIWVTLSVLQAIITMPIVQRSKESNIPVWLTLPIVGCFGLGYILLYTPRSMTVKESSQDLYWIGLCYFVSGGAFALAAVVGCFLKFYSVLNRREKKFKQGFVVFFIVTLVLTIFAVATIFTTSLIYALNIVDISLDSYQSIACMLDFGGSCTGCDSDKVHKMCPEWSEDDVKTVLKTIMKQSASVAAIFLVYAFITLRYGFLLFRHVSNYHIEYV